MTHRDVTETRLITALLGANNDKADLAAQLAAARAENAALREVMRDAVRTGVHSQSCSGWDSADDAKCDCWKARAREALAAAPAPTVPACENCGMRHAPEDAAACIEGHGGD